MVITITVEAERWDQLIAKLIDIIDSERDAAEEADGDAPKPAKKKATKAKAAPKKKAAVRPDPTDFEAEEENGTELEEDTGEDEDDFLDPPVKLSLENVIESLANLAAKVGKEPAQKLLKKVGGVTKAASLDEKHYKAVYDAAMEAAAGDA